MTTFLKRHALTLLLIIMTTGAMALLALVHQEATDKVHRLYDAFSHVYAEKPANADGDSVALPEIALGPVDALDRMRQQEEKDALAAEVASLKIELAGAKAGAKETEKKAADLAGRLTHSVSQSASLASELEVARKKVADLDDRLAYSTRQSTLLAEEMRAAKAATAGQVAQVLQQHEVATASLVAELAKAREENSNLGHRLDDSRSQFASLTSELEAAKAEAANLRQRSTPSVRGTTSHASGGYFYGGGGSYTGGGSYSAGDDSYDRSDGYNDGSGYSYYRYEYDGSGWTRCPQRQRAAPRRVQLSNGYGSWEDR